MSIRPSTRRAWFNSVPSSTTLASGFGAPSGPSFCAGAGAPAAIDRNATATKTRHFRAIGVTAVILSSLGLAKLIETAGSDFDVLVICSPPPPRPRAVAALQHPFLIDLGYDLAV